MTSRSAHSSGAEGAVAMKARRICRNLCSSRFSGARSARRRAEGLPLGLLLLRPGAILRAPAGNQFDAEVDRDGTGAGCGGAAGAEGRPALRADRRPRRSSVGRAVSIRCVRTCFSRSLPFSAGSDLTSCFSAAVKTPRRRTARRSPIRWAWICAGPRPMGSCSNRPTPSQTAASISPWDLTVSSRASHPNRDLPHDRVPTVTELVSSVLSPPWDNYSKNLNNLLAIPISRRK